MIRGDAARHGIVDEATLFRMATEGRLRPEDMVWNKAQGDGWRRAGSIPNLCPKLAEPEKPERAAEEPLGPLEVSKRHRTSFPILLAVGVALISTASWLSQKLYMHEIRPSPRLARLFGIETPETDMSGLDIHAQLAELYLEREDLEKAQAMIAVLANDERTAEAAIRYRRRLAAVQQAVARREELRARLPVAARHLDEGRIEEADKIIALLPDTDEWRSEAESLRKRSESLKQERQRKRRFVELLEKGSIHAGNAATAMAVYRETDSLDELHAALKHALRRRNVLPARLCLNVAHVYRELQQPARVESVLEFFVARADSVGPEADFIEAARLFRHIGKTEKAKHVLNDYLDRNEEKVAARIELAALLCEADDRRSALNHLRVAVRHGDDPARKQALADPRFAPMRDTWSFRRLTRPD